MHPNVLHRKRFSAVLATLGLATMTTGGLMLAASPTVAAGGNEPVTARKGNPPGNNGTIKVDGLEFDEHPNNQPHVGCTFQIDFYNFDEGDFNATVTFSMQPPTGDVGLSGTDPSTVFIGGDPADGSVDAQQTYTLSFDGDPHPVQGYHVRLDIEAPGSIGNDAKHKVFWVEGCGEPTPTETASETPTEEPTETETETTPTETESETPTETETETESETPTESASEPQEPSESETPTETETETESETPTETETETESETPTESASEPQEPSESETPTETETETESETPTETDTESPSATESASQPGNPSQSESPSRPDGATPTEGENPGGNVPGGPDRDDDSRGGTGHGADDAVDGAAAPAGVPTAIDAGLAGDVPHGGNGTAGWSLMGTGAAMLLAGGVLAARRNGAHQA